MIRSPVPSRTASMKEKVPFCGRAAFFNLVKGIYRSMCPVNRVCSQLTLTVIQMAYSNNTTTSDVNPRHNIG